VCTSYTRDTTEIGHKLCSKGFCNFSFLGPGGISLPLFKTTGAVSRKKGHLVHVAHTCTRSGEVFGHVLCIQHFPVFLQEVVYRTWTHNLMVTKQQRYRCARTLLLKGQPSVCSSRLPRVQPLWSYIRSLSLYFYKRLFPILEPITSCHKATTLWLAVSCKP
jgi:hypothetical protein